MELRGLLLKLGGDTNIVECLGEHSLWSLEYLTKAWSLLGLSRYVPGDAT